ncbi:hypothetical protein HDU79_001537 [Rhizoclosmatium sp. JEL0117]|nr:hypothetical protein HDU79_001537 [Rhizoclosmatium sp. JEL0117]
MADQGGPSSGSSSTGARVWTDDIDTAPAESYYDILGVGKDADADQIRRAYRKAALKCHPDKKGDDPVAAEQFQKLLKAYEVLSDEKKRQVYDKYGANGVEMMDKMPFLDVGMILAMKSLFCVITILSAILLLLPIFISMKVDGKISWSWPVVFIPSFLVLGVVLIVVATGSTADEDEDESDKRQSRQERLIEKGYNFVYVLVLTVFDILLPLKLEGILSCSWAAVFIPWFLLEVSHFVSSIFVLVSRIKEGAYVTPPTSLEEAEDQETAKRPLTSGEIGILLFTEFNFYVLRVIQAILLVIKVDNPDTISWGATFVPIYILIVSNLISLTLRFLSGVSQLETPRERRSAAIVFAVVFAAVASIFSVFTWLLVRRVSGNDGYPPAAVLLIPVFFVFALLLCCCGCFLPCMMTVGLQGAMNEMGAQEAGEVGQTGERRERPPVPLVKRIAAPKAEQQQSKTTLVS